jgi:hypothetical protein
METKDKQQLVLDNYRYYSNITMHLNNLNRIRFSGKKPYEI